MSERTSTLPLSRRRTLTGCVGIALALLAVATAHANPRPKERRTMSLTSVQAVPVSFADMPRWGDDDALAAFRAFQVSCSRLNAITGSARGSASAASRLAPACADAAQNLVRTAREARAFFEARFVPHRLEHAGPAGLLTGYYEPELAGSRTQSARFTTPVLARPSDLVTVIPETDRGAAGAAPTHLGATPAGRVPFPSRREIEEGALAGRGLELVYLEHPVDLFFLQVQGSGLIRLPDGRRVRLGYAGKNGHPYTSIGRVLIERGIVPADRMSMQALSDWLRAAGARGREVMWENKAYVFFRELPSAGGPIGAHDIPLTAGRSLAVDPSHHALGLPIYVSSNALTHATPAGGFHRLMIAQDVGSAIKGPERGDIYFGSGAEAERIAGVTRHPGQFFTLLPKSEPAPSTGPLPQNVPAPPGSKP
jgi:membrane-bound lytic murein transglycosylase A